MFQLLQQMFIGVTREQFEADLDTKTHVILLHDRSTLCGFTTLARYTSTAVDHVEVVCSGDTIVHPDAWGSSTLHRAWINAVFAQPPMPGNRLVWLLITSGFRTYRFLPVFFQSYLPSATQCANVNDIAVMHVLAQERWPDEFDPTTGIVRLHAPQRLRDDLATIPAGRRVDDHIAFFERRNPGHATGDELVCMTDLRWDNLTRAGKRMVDRDDDNHAPTTSTYCSAPEHIR